MSLYTLLRHRRLSPAANQPLYHFLRLLGQSPEPPPLHLLHTRSFAFSSAEEAAAERRRRKRRLRIEPPLHALRASAPSPPVRDPNAPRLPDTTSRLVGLRLSLHNRVQSLIRASDLDAASLLARSSVFSGIKPTVFTCNAIIAAMYRNKRFDEAIALFHFFFNQFDFVPNVVSYNNLINTYCDRGEVDKGLETYRHILANAPFGPSAVTYRHLTKGLVDAGRIQDAVDLLREMLNKGSGADSLVYNNVVSGFLELGRLEKANELFDELKERCAVYDGVVNATFMEWWFKQEKDKEAMDSYKSWRDRKFTMIPATCNVLLKVLLKHGKEEQAWALFDDMLDNHAPPNTHVVNSDTFNLMVNECFRLGKFEEGIQTFRKVGMKPNSKPFVMDVSGYSNLIARLNEHGMLSKAEEFFAEMCSKSLPVDVPTYTNMIDKYIKEGRLDDAFISFSNMINSGLRVVADFGTRVFRLLLENGKYVESAGLLKKMGEKETKPDASIYDVVVRGLCSAGELDMSLDMVDEISRHAVGIHPDLKAFVRDVFGKAGRIEEIERVLDENRWETYRTAGPRTRFQPVQPNVNSYMGGQNLSGSSGQSPSRPSLVGAQQNQGSWGQSPSRPSPVGAEQNQGSWGQTGQFQVGVGATQVGGAQQNQGSWVGESPSRPPVGAEQNQGSWRPTGQLQVGVGATQVGGAQQNQGSWAGQSPSRPSPVGAEQNQGSWAQTGQLQVGVGATQGGGGHQQFGSRVQQIQPAYGNSQTNGHQQAGSWPNHTLQSQAGSSQMTGYQQTDSWGHQQVQSPMGSSQFSGHQQPNSWSHQPMQQQQQPSAWGHQQQMQSSLSYPQTSTGHHQSGYGGQPTESHSQVGRGEQPGSWGKQSQAPEGAASMIGGQEQSGSLETAGQEPPPRFSWGT